MGNMRVLSRLRFPSCAVLLVITWCSGQSGLAQIGDKMPTPEQLRSFVRNVDGETRPDLLPFSSKIHAAITSYHSVERLKDVFTPRDNELMQEFRSSILTAHEADATVVDEMYRDLCERVDDLDADSIATELMRMDNVQLERQDARARAFVDSLTPKAASAVLSEAEQVARTIKGANNDVVALAREHPDFLKEQVKRVCAQRGFAPGSAG